MTELRYENGTCTVAAAGTAQQLTSTAYKAISITFASLGTHGTIIGNSDVDWTEASRKGMVVCDGQGAATEIQEVTWNAPGSGDLGKHGSVPCIDMSTIYVDAETNADVVWWCATVLK